MALAEMAMAGGLGADVSLARRPARATTRPRDFVLLFSESPTRFLLEVRPECLGELARRLLRFAARPARRVTATAGLTAERRRRD